MTLAAVRHWLTTTTPAMKETPMPVFDIYDAKPPRRVITDDKCITIGRTADNAVIIDDRLASRIHCEIQASDQGYLIRDLKSRNGTHLNQDLVDQPALLVDGDEIGLGHATVRFYASLDSLPQNAPKLPTLKTSTTSKPATPPASRPAGSASRKPAAARKQAKQPKRAARTPRPPRQQTAPAPQRPATPPPDDAAPNGLDAQIQLIESDLPAATAATAPFKGQLNVNHIIPLNAEGKPAHPVGKQASDVSLAMLRLKELLLKALQFAATDIHVEPKEQNLDVRYRIDGSLHRIESLDFPIAKAIYSIVKLLCNLDITKKGIMQDGSFAVQLPDRRVDLRVSIAPSTRGDKMVLRVLDKSLAPQGLQSLGMEPYILEQVQNKAFRESSMIVICGPTGSGKTTTVYAIIQEMNAQTKNIVTVEDPVEYKLDNVTQIQVNPKFDITFAAALSSLLRQDPDVILIGEMRDSATAQMALQSAMTGHLVLSTVHARDAIGSIFRLLDLGVEPFLLGSALTAVLAQRLLRRLCPKCKMKFRPAMREISRLGLDELAGTHLYTAVGCDHCLGIGYKGRAAIFEMLAITDQVRDAISVKPTIQQLRVAAGDWIFQTLREDGIKKLRQGLTSLDEFQQAVPKE